MTNNIDFIKMEVEISHPHEFDEKTFQKYSTIIERGLSKRSLSSYLNFKKGALEILEKEITPARFMYKKSSKLEEKISLRQGTIFKMILLVGIKQHKLFGEIERWCQDDDLSSINV